MRKNIFLILFVSLLLVYIIFFPHQLKKELVLLPSWGVQLETADNSGFSDEPVPFNFDSKLGYFSGSGKLIYAEDVNYRAAVSDKLFINYSSVSENLVIQETDGDILGIIETEGLPFFIGERLFVISPDRTSVAEFDYEGLPLLNLSPGSVITSMDAGDEIVIIGMLNGEVAVFSDSSEPDFTYFSTDSRYSVTYSCAVTDSGDRFAAVTGLYPQQLVCFELRNNEYTAVFRMNMTDTFRRNLLLDYSDDGRLLYIETAEGLDIYSTATFLKKEIKTAGSINSVHISGEKEISFIVSSHKEQNLVRMYRSDLGRLADLYFPVGDIYFYPADECFYVGVDGRILRYDIIEG